MSSRTRASDLRVRLYFLVNILNARGRSNKACMLTASSLGTVAADGAARLGTSHSSLNLVGSATPVPVTIAMVRTDQMTGSLMKMEPLTWAWRKWTLACERERSTLSLRWEEEAGK